MTVKNLNPFVHLRHARRLWALPASSDRLQSSVDGLQQSVVEIRRELTQSKELLRDSQAFGDYLQEQFTLTLRRLAILDKKFDALDYASRPPDRDDLVLKCAASARSARRVVEGPFIFLSVAGLARSAKILTVVGGQDLVPIGLASLGYHVTILDPWVDDRPNLASVRSGPGDVGQLIRAQSWETDERFDAVVVMSLGELLEAGPPGTNGQRRAEALRWLSHVRRILRRGGRLVLTTAISPEPHSESERALTVEILQHLEEDFQLRSRAVAFQVDGDTWDTHWDVDIASFRQIATDRNAVALLSGFCSEGD